jgi:hypothetical protein
MPGRPGTAIDDDVRVGILALTPDSKIKASFQRPIRLMGNWKPNAQGKLVVNETIDLPTEQLALRVGVTSRALGKTGTTHLSIEPPDFEDKKLQMSGVVIGLPSAAYDAAAGLGSLEGIVPFQPTTVRTFRVGDTLRVYSRLTWKGDAGAATVRLSVTGREGLPVRERSVPAHPEASGRKLAELDVTVPLDGLAAGEYVLRVEASQNQKAVVRQVPFEIK